jgi:hypothetical protein
MNFDAPGIDAVIGHVFTVARFFFGASACDTIANTESRHIH